jgi:hypothetical protein
MALETRRRDLRRLFEALRLEIRYDQTAYMTTCDI